MLSVDEDKTNATYRNLLLTISVPKIEEGRSRRIEAKSDSIRREAGWIDNLSTT